MGDSGDEVLYFPESCCGPGGGEAVGSPPPRSGCHMQDDNFWVI